MEIQYQLSKKQELFRQAAKELSQKNLAHRAAEIDRMKEFPRDAAKVLTQGRLFGLLVPKEYGGEGADFLDFCLAIEELGKICPTSSLICASQNLGSRLILTKGTEEQRKQFLPELATGRAIYGMAIGDAECGSDASRIYINTTLDNSNYVLNGFKSYIINGDVADILMVLAKTNPEALSGFLVEKGLPGFSVENLEKKAGCEGRYAWKGVFRDCHVARENIIGAEGEGFNITMIIAGEVSTTTAARAIGMAQGAIDYSIEYAGKRIQFGRPIAQFQAIQCMLADMTTKAEAARQLIYKAASLVNEGDKDAAKFGAMAKLFASDMAMSITTNAIQVLGSYGYMKEYPVEKMMRNAKLCQISEGNNQIQQLIIAMALIGEN